MSHPPHPDVPIRSDLATLAPTKNDPLYQYYLTTRRYERVIAQLVRGHIDKLKPRAAGVDARDGPPLP